MPQRPNGEGRPPEEKRPTSNISTMIVYDVHGWRVLTHNGLVFITEIDQDREPGLEPWQAMEVALAVLQATLAAKRHGRS